LTKRLKRENIKRKRQKIKKTNKLKILMIKKHTKVVFKDGDFKGEYDWKGGIPLSKGEEMKVKTGGKELNYRLTEKEIVCNAEGEDQIVDVVYTFNLVS